MMMKMRTKREKMNLMYLSLKEEDLKEGKGTPLSRVKLRRQLELSKSSKRIRSQTMKMNQMMKKREEISFLRFRSILLQDRVP